MQLKRVVVTGMGAITPLGNSITEYWNNLRNGVSGADFITQFDATKFKTRFACEIKNFEPTNFLDRKEARKLDRFTQTAVVASDQGVQDAGIDKDNVNVDRVGVVYASGIGGLITFQEEVTNFAKGDGTPRFNPFFIPKMILDIAGAGATADAHHITAPHPEGLGAKNVMHRALEDAGMQASDINYINTHGTSTPLGDVAEIKAIMDVFKEHAFKLNISSTKSMTGHCLGAAGVIEAIACIMAVQNDLIPPTINHFTDDPELDKRLNFTYWKAKHRLVRAALSNTFGFGGHNACMIFKKYSA